MDEGFCSKCGKRVTVPTSKRECEASPDCGPFRQEATIEDDVLDHTQDRWHPLAPTP
jgi:hypothetical protein